MTVDPKSFKLTVHLTERQVDEEKQAAEAYLLRGERQQYTNVGSFHLMFPKKPGVYCIFIADELVYVGQARNLEKRMRDLSIKHSFRRAFGNIHFKDEPNFKRCVRGCFPPELESRLSLHLAKTIKVTAHVVRWGRLEIEEYLIDKYQPVFNTVGRKFS